MKKQSVLLLTLITSILSFAGGFIWRGKRAADELVSHIYKMAEVKKPLPAH